MRYIPRWFFSLALGSSCLLAAPPPEPLARVVTRGGVPALEVDGKPHTGMSRHGYLDTNFSIFRPAGVTLYIPILTASQGFWLPAVWPEPERWDFSKLDAALDGIFSKMPDARVIVKFSDSAPEWWRAQNPAELVQVMVDGKPEALRLPKTNSPLLKAYPKMTRRTVPSWSSPAWRALMARAYEKVIRHIESKPYASRVVGYLLCSGDTNEWFSWGEAPDCSPPNLAGFRAWLRRRYPELTAFRAAWKDSSLRFENAMPPQEEAVNRAGLGALRDPETEAPIVDYLNYNSAMTAETIAALAASIKKCASRPVLVGAYYGYLTASDPRWGHQAVDALMGNPAIDFLCSPSAYWEHRWLGRPASAAPVSMDALGSMRLHGMYWFNENDHITSFSTPDPSWGLNMKDKGIQDDLIIQRRELAWTLAQGVGQWWQDVNRNRFDHPQLLAFISNANAVAEENQGVARGAVDDAAALVDPEAACYIKPGDYMLKYLRRLQIDRLVRSGVASSVYSTADLGRLGDKRLLVFCDLIAPSSATVAAIERLKRDGRVLVFLWAGGAVSQNRLDMAAMQRITGIPIRCRQQEATLRVTTTAQAGPGLEGLVYGVTNSVAPLFLPDAAGGECWGTFAGGEPALVVKRYPDWTSVYSSAPLLAPEILARLGRMAGCHAYAAAGDALWASQGMLAFNAFSAGEKTLRFPKPVKLYECYDRKAYGIGREFTISMEALETRLFRLDMP